MIVHFKHIVSMLICIDCVVYNQYIIHDAFPNITFDENYYNLT